MTRRATPAAPGEASEARRTSIERRAEALGRTWARGRRSDLESEGRIAAGGWPGTLREARLLVGGDLPRGGLGGNLDVMTEAEREIAVRAAYASARAEWLRNAAHDETP